MDPLSIVRNLHGARGVVLNQRLRRRYLHKRSEASDVTEAVIESSSLAVRPWVGWPRSALAFCYRRAVFLKRNGSSELLRFVLFALGQDVLDPSDPLPLRRWRSLATRLGSVL